MWTRQDIDRREALLRTWLNPQAGGEGAGKLAGQPYGTIVQALRQEFPDKKISARSVQRFLQELRDGEPGVMLDTLRRGRPRLRSGDTTPVVEGSTSKSAADAARREVETGIWCELLSLTGLQRTHLHALLRRSEGGGSGMPSLSTFMGRLIGVQPAKPCPIVAELIEWLEPEEHVVRLHQVTLDGPNGELQVIALAYDPKTHYVNAQLIVLHRRQRNRQPGRPVTRLTAGPPPQVTLVDGRRSVVLSASWWRDFLDDTKRRMQLPVAGALVSPSLGPTELLLVELRALEPDGVFLGVPGDAQTTLRGRSVSQSVEALRRSLIAILNHHNRQVAAPHLERHRRHVEDCKAVAASKSDAWLAEQERYASLFDLHLPDSKEERAEVRRRVQIGLHLVLQDKLSPLAPHRGTLLACHPLRWEVEGDSDSDAEQANRPWVGVGVKPTIPTPLSTD